MYYNYNKIRSYNALFNFIISNRGGGKSYGAKEMVIKNFLKRDIMTLKNEYLLTRGINSSIIIKTGDVVKIDWMNETITK